MDAYENAAKHLLELPEGDAPLIAFVGPSCRTWYVDLNRLRALIGDLHCLRPFEVVHGGKFPFDMYVEQFCEEMGIAWYLNGPADRKVRLTKDYSRDPDLAAGLSLLVAFPWEDGAKEGKPKADGRHPPESADLDVVRGAAVHGVPVLAVYRDGRAVWVEGGTST
jgi:hypothetical protein